jgi:hypothetical protein
MTAKPPVDDIRNSRVLLLHALSVFINYLDRGNLSIAAPLLIALFARSRRMKELSEPPTERVRERSMAAERFANRCHFLRSGT